MNPDRSTGNNMDCVNDLPEIYRSCPLWIYWYSFLNLSMLK